MVVWILKIEYVDGNSDTSCWDSEESAKAYLNEIPNEHVKHSSLENIEVGSLAKTNVSALSDDSLEKEFNSYAAMVDVLKAEIDKRRHNKAIKAWEKAIESLKTYMLLAEEGVTIEDSDSTVIINMWTFESPKPGIITCNGYNKMPF